MSPAGCCTVSPLRCPTFSTWIHTAPSHFISSQTLRQEEVSEREGFLFSLWSFSVSPQPPAASEPDQTPPAEWLNTTPLNATTPLFLPASLSTPSCLLQAALWIIKKQDKLMSSYYALSWPHFCCVSPPQTLHFHRPLLIRHSYSSYFVFFPNDQQHRLLTSQTEVSRSKWSQDVKTKL